MIPFMQNSRKCRPIYSDRIDSWLPRDWRSRRKDYKEAEGPLGMRNTFIILMWWWLHACVCSAMSDSWWWLHECIQRSSCTGTADRLSKTKTENWPFNSGTWWSSAILMGVSAEWEGPGLMECIHERVGERDSRKWVQTTLSRNTLQGSGEMELHAVQYVSIIPQ